MEFRVLIEDVDLAMSVIVMLNVHLILNVSLDNASIFLLLSVRGTMNVHWDNGANLDNV